MKKSFALIGILLSANVSAAGLYHDGSQFYLGYGYGYHRQDISADSSINLAASHSYDWGHKFTAGMRFNPTLAVEGFHYDFGTVPFHSRTNVKAKTSGIAALASLPVTRDLSLYGKVGIHAWDQKVWHRSQYRRSDDVDVMYGAGINLNVNNLSLRLEHERFDMHRDEIGVTTANILINFQ